MRLPKAALRDIQAHMLKQNCNRLLPYVMLMVDEI